MATNISGDGEVETSLERETSPRSLSADRLMGRHEGAKPVGRGGSRGLSEDTVKLLKGQEDDAGGSGKG